MAEAELNKTVGRNDFLWKRMPRKWQKSFQVIRFSLKGRSEAVWHSQGNEVHSERQIIPLYGTAPFTIKIHVAQSGDRDTTPRGRAASMDAIKRIQNWWGDRPLLLTMTLQQDRLVGKKCPNSGIIPSPWAKREWFKGIRCWKCMWRRPRRVSFLLK